jgi:peptidoglycan/xylan/chitin deacetylase (PgdA/CDA1 family)
VKKNRKISVPYVACACALAALALLFFYVDRASSRVVPILMYHSVSDKKDASTPTTDIEIFERQMKFLAENRFNVIGPDKAIDYMTGKERMPAKTVLLTFDDGEYDFYENAYPVLKRYGLHATIFVITDYVGRHGSLGWRELREMSDSGLIIVASHTKSHPWLPSVSVDEEKLRDEFAGSKEALEKALGKGVDYVCYPNGGFNDLVKEAAKRYGYRGAFTTNPSNRRDALDDIYAMRRIKMSSSSRNAPELWGKLNRFYAWYKERR